MNEFCKAARIEKSAAVDEGELALINAQALRPLAAEEVFVFRLAACDDQVDRDFERFTKDCLEALAPLYVGKPVLKDHQWRAGEQTARVYAAQVETRDGVSRLVLRCYMPRTEGTAETITAIESGMLRECSVGVAVGRATCSICGANQLETLCKHGGGREYDGQVCHFDLDDPRDAYEVSLVAVPAQKEAGIIKAKRYGGAQPLEDTDPPGGGPGDDSQNWQAKALLELEKNRFNLEGSEDETQTD
ncbi:MAG TPA: hypothetical protein IAC25_02415 [Candidatus Enterenecus stercoripullorum]|nr:hypothetical protein [Candidatus Enterenecus stercoripullorum]